MIAYIIGDFSTKPTPWLKRDNGGATLPKWIDHEKMLEATRFDTISRAEIELKFLMWLYPLSSGGYTIVPLETSK